MYQVYPHKNRIRVPSFRRTGLLQLRTLFISTALVTLSMLPARSQNTFFNLYGSVVADQGDRMISVPGGGYVFAGATDAAGFGGKDIAVTRVDAAGNVLWCRNIGTTDEESVGNLVAIPGGGFYVVMTMSDPTGTAYATTAVLKLDINGGVVWTRKFSSVSNAYGQDILATSSGGFVFLTTDDSTTANPARPKIVACDSNGTVMWSNVYMVRGTIGNHSIVECSNGDYVVACSTYDTINDFSVTLLRVDNSGNLLWCRQSLLGSLSEYVFNMVYANDQFFVETWRFDSIRVNCFSATGVSLWTKGLKAPFGVYYGSGHLAYSNGKILIVRRIIDMTLGYVSGLIAEVDTNGVLLNSGVLHYGVNTYLNDAGYNSNGDWVLCGTAISGFAANDTSSVFLAVGDPQNGTLCGYTSIPFSVNSEPAMTGTSLNIAVVNSGTSSALTMQTSTGILMQTGCIVGVEEMQVVHVNVYPNPVSDILIIEQQGETGSGLATEISIYNNLGQCVMIAPLTEVQTKISLENLGAGVYCYQLRKADGIVQQGKLIKSE